MTILEVPFSDPSVNKLILACFPGARSKRNVKVRTAETYLVSDYWSGGSREECRFVSLETGEVLSSLPMHARQQENNPLKLAIGQVHISPGFAVVEHCIFQGKDLGYRVYLNPENMAKMLPASSSSAALTERDKRILVSFRSLKSGPYRQEALQALNYGPEDSAKLCGLGYLKQASNGPTGITNSGRAIVAGER